MRIGAASKQARRYYSSVINPRHKLLKADIKVPTPCGRISPIAYLEPTELVRQAQRFARHLIDKRRPPPYLTARKMPMYPLYIRHIEVIWGRGQPPPPGVELK